MLGSGIANEENEQERQENMKQFFRYIFFIVPQVFPHSSPKKNIIYKKLND